MTELYFVSCAVPLLRGENANQKNRDDTLSQVFDSEATDEPVSSLVSSAHYLSENARTNKQVQPAGVSNEEPAAAGGFSKLFRWRRKPAVPQDPFEEEIQSKLSQPVPTSKSKSTVNAKPDSTSKSSYTVADAIEALDVSGSDGATSDQSAAESTAKSDQSAAPTGQAAVVKQRDISPLATRRRLLEQLEKAVDEAKSPSATNAPKPKDQPQDAETEFHDTKKDATDQPSKTQERNTNSVISRVATRPEVPTAPAVSDQELRSLFEQPDETEPARAESATVVQESKAEEKVGAKSTDSASRAIRPADVLDAEELPKKKLPKTVPNNTDPQSTEVPVEALRFRARQAKEQGRASAARYLELAADSIEKQHQTSRQTNELQTQLAKQESRPVTQQVANFDEAVLESVSDTPATPSQLPGTRPAFEKNDPDAVPTTEAPISETVDRKSSPVGRAKLLPESTDETESARTSVDVPGNPQPAQRPHIQQRRISAATAQALRETVKVAEKPDFSQTIRITPRQKFDSLTSLGSPQVNLPVQDVTTVPAQEVITKAIEVPTPVETGLTDKRVAISGESPVPSLIPTRPYTPKFQVTANRPVYLSAPEGWSASKSVATVPIQVPEIPSRTSDKAESSPTTPPFEPITKDIEPSLEWPVELNAIEEDPVEPQPGPFEVMNGREVVQNNVKQKPLRDAHYRTDAQAIEPVLIDDSIAETSTLIEPTRQSWQPSWLIVAGTALLAMIGTLFWTRKGERQA